MIDMCLLSLDSSKDRNSSIVSCLYKCNTRMFSSSKMLHFVVIDSNSSSNSEATVDYCIASKDGLLQEKERTISNIKADNIVESVIRLVEEIVSKKKKDKREGKEPLIIAISKRSIESGLVSVDKLVSSILFSSINISYIVIYK